MADLLERLHHPRKLGCVALALTLLCGCSTVRSVDLSQTTVEARKNAYLTYSVAKSLFAIQIAAAGSTSMSGGTAAAGASGGGSTTSSKAGSGAGAPPPSSTPTSWVLNGTLNASGASPPSGAGQAAASAVDSSPCGERRAEYAAAQAMVTKRASDRIMLVGKLQKMADGDLATETPKALSEHLEDYVKELNDTGYLALVRVSQQTLYGEIVDKCAPKVTVSIQQTIVPDIKRSFALLPQTNPFYTDALTLGVDANGFLTNGAPTSTSEVAQTASAIANDVGLAVAPSPPTRAVNLAAPIAPAGQSAKGLVERKPGKPKGPFCRAVSGTDFIADIESLSACNPKTDASIAKALANRLLDRLVARTGAPQPARLLNLPASLLPLTFYTTLADWQDGGAPKPDRAIAAAVKQFQLDLRLACAPRNGPKGATAEPPAAIIPENDNSNKVGVYDGLVVSAARQCRFQANQVAQIVSADEEPAAKRAGVFHLISDTYFLAQDSRYLSILPTQRGFLVPRSVAYTFSGGQPTGVTDSRPSEALAIASFPGQVVGAFFSGLTSAFTNSQVGVNGRTADLTAQTNYLTAQANLAAAKKAAAAAPAGAPSP